jgi:hypothetical protein
MDGDSGLFGGPFAEAGEAALKGGGSTFWGVFVDYVLVGDLFGFAVDGHFGLFVAE